MVRPRPAGFFYTEEEFVLMKGQAEALLKAGADGIAFGFLTKEREVDERRTKEMVSLIHQYGGTAVFHRAFDLTKDADASMQSLISAGIDRALTSGQMPKAIDGLALLAYLQRQYGNQIEILAGSGIHEGNVQAFVQAGLSQVHSSCKGYVMDPTTTSKTMGFSYLEGPYQNDYEVTSAGKVRQLLEALAQA
jgi:copper homeostasis protein